SISQMNSPSCGECEDLVLPCSVAIYNIQRKHREFHHDRRRRGLGLLANSKMVQQAEHAAHTMHTLFVDDLDALVGQIANRGLDPVKRETYSNGVRKTTYRDPDGNEIGFGGARSNPGYC